MQIFQNPNFYLNTVLLVHAFAQTTFKHYRGVPQFCISESLQLSQGAAEKPSPIVGLLQPSDSRRAQGTGAGRKHSRT